jgi:hypothetical protein
MDLNLGTDVVGWLYITKIAVWLITLCFVLHKAFLVYKLTMKVTGIKDDKERDAVHSYIKKHARYGIVYFVILLAYTLAAFVLFGSGNAPQTPDAEEDGHRQMVQARPAPPTKGVIKEEANTNDDSYLKDMDRGPEKERKEANDYIEKALERSKNR